MFVHLRLLAPVFFRLILIVCAGLAVAGFTSITGGLIAVIVGLLIEISMHLNFITRLDVWLEQSTLDTPPAASSAIWNDIFARIYKNRKALDKNTRRLQEREERYRKTLDNIPAGILVVKKDWSLSWCNRDAEKICGISHEKDAGRHVFALITDRVIIDFIKAGDFDSTLTWHPANSATVYEIKIVVPDRKNAIMVFRDISEREKLDTMRRDFVANVSHELRTPVTALSGFLAMAADNIQENDGDIIIAPKHFKLMQDEANRMSRLIEDLLTLSSLEYGPETKTMTEFSLDTMVREVTDEIQTIYGASHSIGCSTTGITMRGYPTEVRGILTNLATNAVRYTPEGGRVRISCRTDADGAFELSVSDTGIGIAPKDIPRLTERFYRVDKSRSCATGGTGLGLAIVKHALLNHRGRLDIASLPDKGSTFTVHFPAELLVTEKAPSESEEASEKTDAGKKETSGSDAA